MPLVVALGQVGGVGILDGDEERLEVLDGIQQRREGREMVCGDGRVSAAVFRCNEGEIAEPASLARDEFSRNNWSS